MSRVPSQRAFLPFLARLLDENGPMPSSVAIETVADRYGLNDDQRAIMSESKVWEPKYRNVIRWARQDLNFAGLLNRDVGRGVWALNTAGHELVAEHRHDDETLVRAIYSLQPRGESDSQTEPIAHNVVVDQEPLSQSTVEAPDEAVLDALSVYERYIKEGLRRELLEVSPTRFEYIVADVLAASLRAARQEVTPPSRDGGIDGVLWLDHLALTKAVFQAKQYDENKVPREKVDAFYAAARRENAAAMVYVTTSRYSSEAIDAARAFGVRLIDGTELVDLMLKVGVGVREQRRLSLYTIDDAYFEDDA